MFTGIISHLGKVNKILHPDDWELLVDILDAENLDKSYNINSTPIGASISCSGTVSYTHLTLPTIYSV